MNVRNTKPGDNFRSQVLFEPTRNFLGIPDDVVNVTFSHFRQTKAHNSRNVFLTSPEERQSDQPAWMPILRSICEAEREEELRPE